MQGFFLYLEVKSLNLPWYVIYACFFVFSTLVDKIDCLKVNSVKVFLSYSEGASINLMGWCFYPLILKVSPIVVCISLPYFCIVIINEKNIGYET